MGSPTLAGRKFPYGNSIAHSVSDVTDREHAYAPTFRPRRSTREVASRTAISPVGLADALIQVFFEPFPQPDVARTRNTGGKMASKSAARKREKPKRKTPPKAKPRRAARLDAQEGFVRNLDRVGPGKRKKRSDRHPRPPSHKRTQGPAHPAPSEWLGLMSRCAQAYIELPTRLVRCRSPFELWTEQARFAQAVLADCQTVARRALAPWTRADGG
jgi:hypothetical protein